MALYRSSSGSISRVESIAMDRYRFQSVWFGRPREWIVFCWGCPSGVGMFVVKVWFLEEGVVPLGMVDCAGGGGGAAGAAGCGGSCACEDDDRVMPRTDPACDCGTNSLALAGFQSAAFALNELLLANVVDDDEDGLGMLFQGEVEADRIPFLFPEPLPALELEFPHTEDDPKAWDVRGDRGSDADLWKP